ncbi:MAG: peptidylprolyl isomerase [Deltaproteobacteria bacterium]|nr:peptidylprolyl isomerase [Deltaproteobacteria bacterium]
MKWVCKAITGHVMFGCIFLIAGIGVAQEKVPAQQNVATVNGNDILKRIYDHEVNMAMSRQRGAQVDSAAVENLKKMILDMLINTELLYQESHKKGIRVSETDLSNRMAGILKNFPSEDEFRNVISQRGLIEGDIKHKIKQELAIQTLIDKEITASMTVSDADVRSQYDARPELSTVPERVQASHILIKVAPDADGAKKEAARKKIAEIKKQLSNGQDFAELAKTHSECPSSANGGNLGLFARGQMVKPFETVAFSMKPMEVSDLVETPFGYHLIKVMDHQTGGRVSYDQASAQIQKRMRAERVSRQVKAYIETLRETAEIEMLL